MLKSKTASFAWALTLLILLPAMPVGAQSLADLHKAALKEGGTVNFYASLAQINAEKILPEFERRAISLRSFIQICLLRARLLAGIILIADRL